jgi:alpha-D-xyloside xylohydrolase
MKIRIRALQVLGLLFAGTALTLINGCAGNRATSSASDSRAVLTLRSKNLTATANDQTLKLDGLFYETAQGRFAFPPFSLDVQQGSNVTLSNQTVMPDRRSVAVRVKNEGDNFSIQFSAAPSNDIVRWGLAVEARGDEYFTGLMERVVDGPQQASWSPGRKEAMNLRGQKIEMILKPTTSVYAPFYLSSRGYSIFAQTDWPGVYDFCKADRRRVGIQFEGPSLTLKIYTAVEPAALVKQHALDAGPPFLPPKWVFAPWRWRDEHTQRVAYFDGTPVTGPFNSETMEDLLMMKAFGIPCGVYWIDRPWGKGQPWGYDDFEIDEKRLPNFAKMIQWLGDNDQRLVLWIAPFFQGRMATNALERGWNLPGQVRPENGNNFPMVDLTNPDAKKYWQDGVEKLVKLGVAGFKLDRAEEDIPDDGPQNIFDGRTLRENRNAYAAMYVKAVYDVAKKHRGEDFALMPRAAYTGSSPYGIFWGGDISGTQEGLRASIVAAQRCAVMGYPNWGSDTCGYNDQRMEQEVCARWLAFSCFTPIMEVGPTKNVAFWNLPRKPEYDTALIATWRLYARLHQRLVDYTYRHAEEAHRTGMPIVRPLFLMDPKSQAWENWWSYLYGADLLVSPIWEKGKREQLVYLPSGNQWQDAWQPERTYSGGQTITVRAELHQIPIFVRVGSDLSLGDLNQDWNESLAIAQKKPDLHALEAEVIAWFNEHK